MDYKSDLTVNLSTNLKVAGCILRLFKYPAEPKKIQHNKTQNSISTFIVQTFIVLSGDHVFIMSIWWEWGGGSKEIVQNLGDMLMIKHIWVHRDVLWGFFFGLSFSKF